MPRRSLASPVRAAAAPYLGLDETAFAAVAANLRANKPKVPADPNLFAHVATTGNEAAPTDATQFAAAIRTEQHRAAQAGETVTVLGAARRVRTATNAG